MDGLHVTIKMATNQQIIVHFVGFIKDMDSDYLQSQAVGLVGICRCDTAVYILESLSGKMKSDLALQVESRSKSRVVINHTATRQ